MLNDVIMAAGGPASGADMKGVEIRRGSDVLWGPEATQGIEFTYELVQRQNNILLHSSPIGYSLAMSPAFWPSL